MRSMAFEPIEGIHTRAFWLDQGEIVTEGDRETIVRKYKNEMIHFSTVPLRIFALNYRMLRPLEIMPGMFGTAIRDFKKIAFGVLHLLRYLTSEDRISVCLSLFSSNSVVVKEGAVSHYEIVLANNALHPLCVIFLFDIYLRSNPTHPEGHYAFFKKNVYVRSRENQKIRISYNWEDSVVIDIDDIPTSPDDFWRGRCRIKGKYFVHVSLLNEESKSFDRLTLVQELS